MFLLPTLNRIEKLKNCLAAMSRHKMSTPGLILVDDNDYQLHKEAYDALVLPDRWLVVQTKAVTMGDKCREIFPRLENECSWVGLLNDDHEVACDDWDQKLLKRINGQTFTSANDRSYRTFITPVTATVWSMPLLKALGWPIYPPQLQHLFIDDVWREIGNRSGNWRICADSIVLHKHVLFGEGVMDETHQKVYNQKAWDMDKAIYDNFMKHDLEDVVKKVKSLDHLIGQQKYNPDMQSPLL